MGCSGGSSAIGIKNRDWALKAEDNEFNRIFFSPPFLPPSFFSLTRVPEIRNYVTSPIG